ncbi:peroxiredoxin-like family protein [Phaeodactylibacter sp.]|uniref:peroxiredoxin-like family protein n=1 Tax=Phaeodactylibacter sp. TaxID=1940289 RepID=UPI0025EBB5D8|nr:peroxiredoxin-like family protein [Phaeodactylibacter sp.]MCI4651514.1 AhpC/TSA family protein [Phaeodactylibacter sp.]MCI5092770.1 AhpC/TSA family protein [Phaeodactylibacter sp.]
MSTATQIPSYSEELETLQNQLGNMLPKEALSVFETDANALQSAHQQILKLSVGDKAPKFSLSNAIGETVTLKSLLEKGKVVLTFYRGTWCPYCNLQLNQYQRVLEDIKGLGANLVAISPQTPDESLNMKEKNELAFEVLSDNSNMVARQFTTVFKNGEAPIETMTALGIDFDGHYSDDSQELPVPAVFIIEQDYTISFAKAIGGDYRNRVEAADIIEALSN